jgi:hypothetical protein
MDNVVCFHPLGQNEFLGVWTIPLHLPTINKTILLSIPIYLNTSYDSSKLILIFPSSLLTY